MDKIFVMHPETFIFQDKEGFLLYHTENHTCAEYPHNIFTDRMFSHLSTLASLYRFKVAEEELSAYLDFIKDLVNQGFGTLHDNEEVAPFSYPPIIKLDYDFNRLQKMMESHEGGYILDFLHEVTFYLSGNPVRSPFSRQILCPFKRGGRHLRAERCMQFLDKTRYSQVSRINLMIASAEDVHTAKHLILTSRHPEKFHSYFFAKDWDPDTILSYASDVPGTFLEIVCEVQDLRTELSHIPHHIVVRNPRELARARQTGGPAGGSIVPVLESGDLSFFRDNVFIAREDLFTESRRNIHIHQILNSHFFGKLSVFPDGTVRPGVGFMPLGTIDDSLFCLIGKEITEGSAWFLTRDRLGCRTCRYKYLCPSPSYYEILSGIKMCFKDTDSHINL